MRVVYVIDSNLLSGVEKRFLNILLHNFKIKSFDVTLVVNEELFEELKYHDYYSSVLNGNIEILKFPIKSSNKYVKTLLRYYYFFKYREKFENADTVHLILDFYSFILFKILGKRTIFELSSPEVVDRVLKWYKKPFLKYFDVLNCVSPSVLQRLKVKYNGSNIKVAPITFYDKKNISRKIIESKEKSIVFGSRFLARKNPVLFAEIMDKILNEYPEWNGYVLGGGELEQEVRSILKVHIESGLVYVGRVAEFLGVLKKSSIYVSIIQPDNYPSQSVLEAMNTYNLLLISDTGNSDKFIDQENYHGELVELNFNSIYSGLVRLINKHECVECRLHSFDHLNNTFSPDIYFSHLHEIYK